MHQRQQQLETVLKLRQTERDRQRAAWATAHGAESALQTEWEQAAAVLAELQAAVRRCASPGTTDLLQLGDQQRYAYVLRERLADVTRRRDELRQQAHQLHQGLLAADREVRILEKLRDKRSAQDQATQLKSEAGRLREVVLQKVGVARTGDFSDK